MFVRRIRQVRDVACAGEDVIVTVEEVGKVHVWKRVGDAEFAKAPVFPKDVHDNMILAVESVQSLPHVGMVFDKPTFISQCLF